MIRVWLILIRSGSSWAWAHYGGMQYVYAYRTRGEAQEDLAAARKQFGRRDVKLVSFVAQI